jgi:hypothetical protein
MSLVVIDSCPGCKCGTEDTERNVRVSVLLLCPNEETLTGRKEDDEVDGDGEGDMRSARHFHVQEYIKDMIVCISKDTKNLYSLATCSYFYPCHLRKAVPVIRSKRSPAD